MELPLQSSKNQIRRATIPNEEGEPLVAVSARRLDASRCIASASILGDYAPRNVAAGNAAITIANSRKSKGPGDRQNHGTSQLSINSNRAIERPATARNHNAKRSTASATMLDLPAANSVSAKIAKTVLRIRMGLRCRKKLQLTVHDIECTRQYHSCLSQYSRKMSAMKSESETNDCLRNTSLKKFFDTKPADPNSWRLSASCIICFETAYWLALMSLLSMLAHKTRRICSNDCLVISSLCP